MLGFLQRPMGEAARYEAIMGTRECTYLKAFRFNLKIPLLPKQTPRGYDVACRLPDCNNIRFAGKHRVKEKIKMALAQLTGGAGTEPEKR